MQRDDAGTFGRPLIEPVVHDELVVHPEARAVIARDVERVGLAEARLHLPEPAHGELLDAHRRIGRAGAPVEVHHGINATNPRAGEVDVVVVIPAQPDAVAKRGRIHENGDGGGRCDRESIVPRLGDDRVRADRRRRPDEGVRRVRHQAEQRVAVVELDAHDGAAGVAGRGGDCYARRHGEHAVVRR